MTHGVSEETDQVPAYSWYALAVLFLVYLTNFVDRQILSILANDIKTDLAIGDAELGFLYGTAFAIFYALFGIPLGRVADGSQRLRLLGLGLALWSMMTMLSGLSKNLGQLTIARIGVGVGEATANPCAYSLIADWFPPRMRAFALSLYSSGLFVGSGLSLVLGGAIVDGWEGRFGSEGPLGLAGWQAAFIGAGLPGIVLTIWVLSLREPGNSAKARSGKGLLRIFLAETSKIIPPFTLIAAARHGGTALAINLGFGVAVALITWLLTQCLGNPQQFALVGIGYYAVFSWAQALRQEDPATFAFTFGNTSFVAIVILYAAISYTGYTVTYWAAPFAERTYALSKTDLGMLVGAPNALGGFIGVIAGGWLADRLHRHFSNGRLMVASFAILLPIPLILLGYTTDKQELFLACNFLVQVATASAMGACAAASQGLVKHNMRGTAAGIFLLGPTLIGLAFGPFTAGFISELTGDLALGVKFSLIALIPGFAALILVIRHYEGGIARLQECRSG